MTPKLPINYENIYSCKKGIFKYIKNYELIKTCLCGNESNFYMFPYLY